MFPCNPQATNGAESLFQHCLWIELQNHMHRDGETHDICCKETFVLDIAIWDERAALSMLKNFFSTRQERANVVVERSSTARSFYTPGYVKIVQE